MNPDKRALDDRGLLDLLGENKEPLGTTTCRGSQLPLSGLCAEVL